MRQTQCGIKTFTFRNNVRDFFTAKAVSFFQEECHGCTNGSNLEMEQNYLAKSDVQLNPDIFRIKNDKRVLSKALQ